MPDYRIYRIEEDGHIAHRPLVVTCDSDEEAVENARKYLDGMPLEVWRLDRCVSRLDPEKISTASPKRSQLTLA